MIGIVLGRFDFSESGNNSKQTFLHIAFMKAGLLCVTDSLYNHVKASNRQSQHSKVMAEVMVFIIVHSDNKISLKVTERATQYPINITF